MIKIPNPPTRALSFTLAALAFLGLAAPSTAEDYSRRIVWKDSSHKEAAFLPQAVLETTEIDQLPQDAYSAGALRDALSQAKDPVWGRAIGVYTLRQECAPSSPPPLPGSAPWAKSLLGSARESEVVAVAKVIQLVPGWSTSTGRIAQLVYLSVETPLLGAQSLESTGGVLAFQHPVREVWVWGLRLCAETVGSLQPLEVGDRLLVLGRQAEEDPLFLHVSSVHRVVEGLIRPTPYPEITDKGDLPLSALQAALRGEEVKP